MVISNTFLFMVLWNIFYLMLVVLRHLLFAWLNTLEIRKLTQPKLMRLITWKVLANPLENLSLSSTILDRTHLSQTPIITSLNKKYFSTTYWKLTQSKMASPKIRTMSNQLVLREFPLLYPLKPLKKSTRSPNFSRQRCHLIQMVIEVCHMHRPLR